ncbi:MAG: hypothetical protein ACK5LE_06915 [Alphaproteobacteria bacterium]
MKKKLILLCSAISISAGLLISAAVMAQTTHTQYQQPIQNIELKA